MAISLLFLLSPIIISALEIQLNAPNSVNINEEFKVSISADTQDIYDVKIFVEDENSTSKTISQIYNGNKWQSSYYYIKQAFPSQSEFSLKITKTGEWNICARLRKEAQNPSAPICRLIMVLLNEKDKEKSEEKVEANQQENNEELGKENIGNDIKNESKLENNKEIVNYNINRSNSQINLIQAQEKIILNPKQSKKEEQQVFITKYDKIRNGIIYSFIAFCIILIILLALKRL